MICAQYAGAIHARFARKSGTCLSLDRILLVGGLSEFGWINFCC